MPCVCLAHTFAQWKRVKALKLAERKAERIEPDMTVAERGIFSPAKEGHIWRVPHTRVPRPSRPELPYMNDAPRITRRPSARLTRADLLNAESKLGSTIFGPIPEGHRREFFHDRNNIWIWHEDWYDGRRNPRQMTVRYEVRTSGIYKKVSTGHYLKLEGDELENFRKATRAYLHLIKKNLYNKPQNTSTPAAR